MIFSPTYLAKNWTIREFYTLLAKEIEEQKVILPVLYNITLDELRNKDLVMADRFAVNSDKGMDFVVDRLVREIRKKPVVKKHMAWFSRIWLGLILSLVANVLFLCKQIVLDRPASPISSFDTAKQPPGFSGQPAGLLREIRNAVAQIQDCHCHHRLAEDQPMLVKAGFASSGESFGAPPSQLYEPSNEADSRRQGWTRRMTMAVVFQIEAPALTSDAREADMDEIFSASGAQQRSGQFETVSTLGTTASRGCTHNVPREQPVRFPFGK